MGEGRRTLSSTQEKQEHKTSCYSTALLKCKKQYTGETKCTLREHFTEHRQATRNPPHANDEAAVPIRPLYHRHGTHFTGITARSQHIPSQSTSSIPHR